MHDGHLTEEELVEIATGDASGPQLKHLEICRECSQAITELQIVKSALSSIDDQEIPRKTEREILLLSQKSKCGAGKCSQKRGRKRELRPLPFCI